MPEEQRASIFGEDESDLSGFRPRQPATAPTAKQKQQVREISEAANFRSREPVSPGPVDAPTPQRREPRRHRTGRNVQLNLKVRQEASDKFYQLADHTGWVLGEIFERAIDALNRELDGSATSKR